MFCFQRQFSRSTTAIKSDKLLGEKLSSKIGRMKDENSSIKVSSSDGESVGDKLHGELINEESPIKFIDQEMSISESSSTDTLPGVKTDYLDDPLSINSSSAPLATLDAPSTVVSKSLPYQKTNNGGWRKKFLLYLRSDSSNSDVNNSSTSSISSTPSSLSSSKLPSTPLIVKQSNDAKIGNIKTNLAHDIRSLNGFSEDEDDDVIIDDDDEDDEEIETENEDGSSLPSSPAVVNQINLTPGQVPFNYPFLSVNCGAMRQEVTSTSSPQLSNNLSSDDDQPTDQLTSSKTAKRECLTVGINLKKPDTLDSNCLSAARSCPNLEQQSIGSSTSGSSSPIPSPGPAGPRFKPLEEGDIQVCYLNHTRTLVSKILSSKFLRRWETHHLYLNDACLSSKTPTGFLQQAVPYSSMSEVYTIARWDPTYKYCLRIVLPDGSLLLQASNAYTRDQWYHSILWKKSIFKYQHLMSTNQKEETILKELKALVDFALWTPLQDERINGTPLEVVAKLLDVDNEKKILETLDDNNEDRKRWAEAILAVASPLLEKAAPPPVLARVFAKLTEQYPTSSLVSALMPAITRCLKHTVDFGKSPDMRKLIQVFIAALYEKDYGEQSVRDYIRSIHGFGSDCPHPRILPNLVSICVAAIFHRFDVSNVEPLPPLDCYLLVLKITSEYGDWRPGLSALLQPVPFPESALSNEKVQEAVLLVVMRRLAQDSRCSVHRVLLPVREPRPGWIHIAAPSSLASPDDGTLFGEMLTTMLGCCCRRKKFISSLLKHTGSACILLGVRGCDAAQEALCLMLEWRLLPNEEAKLQVVSALQSTKSGRERYSALCQRQRNLQELQQKGGPKKLTLPVRATDADVALLLDGGAHGNLECLSLAFTSVTSACAEQLIKLPALRYLNLWATQFGDTGLQMISEHLQKLQVLNLCETPVSDKGISTLASLTNLRKLNLNSTKLSAQTFESLKKCLPALQEFDVRYTEAW